MKKRELCAFMVVLDSTLVIFRGQWQWSRESEWNLGMQSSGGSVTLPSRQKMVLVPDIKRYWELKHQSDWKSLWWAEQIWTTTSPELTYMHLWGAFKLLQFSIIFIYVFFFMNGQFVCWLYVFRCVYSITLKGAGYNNWSFSHKTVYLCLFGTWKVLSLLSRASLPMLHSRCLRLNQSLCFGIKEFFMMVICWLDNKVQAIIWCL